MSQGIQVDDAQQLGLFDEDTGFICLICHKPGARLRYNRPLDDWFYANGEKRQVVAYGWRHETCL